MNGLLAKLTVAGSVAAGVALLVVAVRLPLNVDDTFTQRRASESPALRTGDTTPLASFAPAWSLDLRRSLTDTPQRVASTQPQNMGNLVPVRLVGTIVDAVRPRGIFITPLGQMELRGVGEKMSGVEILRIDERSATVLVAGQPVTIRVEKLEISIPGGGPDPAVPPSARINER